jgi:BirA family transcriptional regulator, biotin operon repressor / biotin---[acetyl-CoA-carboxylase] ligase
MIDVVRILRETTIARAEHRPTVTSTNDRAAECAAKGLKELPLLVVADEQTAGRGRGSNTWWTGTDSLAFSLLVDAETVGAHETRSPLVALAVAVAVVDVAAPLVPGHQVGLRWPNDVYAAERKIAGILVEVLPDRKHVIGIGLNTNNTVADAPPALRNTVGTLRDLSGRRFDQTGVLVDLLRRLDQRFAELRADAKAIAARADEMCLQRGQRLTLEWADRKATGICRGIAPDGALLLETSGGVEAFHSGTLLQEP